jgi:1-deoxy-D-xylulose-5-phosphate reductoisomerase
MMNAAPLKTVTILGATGSVGLSTLDLVRRNPKHFSVKALTAHTNVETLAKLAWEFRPDIAVISANQHLEDLISALDGSGVACLGGESGLIEAAQAESDIVMAAIVGAAGLKPTLAAVSRGATIALANKECLVCAGDIMMAQARESGSKILPVDSEHNAIFQVFDANAAKTVEKIILTASGGPFRERSLESLHSVTPDQAVAHPNWDMGRKISVDSATMMNKGLEVIEAYHLFPVRTDQIEVIIHPQSVIHSMVQYIDGSVLAQLGSPDMRTPIAYSLAWPERMNAPVDRLSLAEIGTLSFTEPDMARFPCLELAMNALKTGGAAPTILNAANEIAVEAFLAEKIRFIDISSVVSETLEISDMKAPQSISMVFDVDAEARRQAEHIVKRLE